MLLIDCSLPLVLQGRVYALPDVWIRPAFGGKGRKVTGTLEAHANGFRYTSPKGEELDIMYRWDRFEGYGPSLGGQPPVNAPAAWQADCLVPTHYVGTPPPPPLCAAGTSSTPSSNPPTTR